MVINELLNGNIRIGTSKVESERVVTADKSWRLEVAIDHVYAK